ncbi:PAS domain-containing sensor histidine kinase [Marivirga sp. S37H4]|uniref:histidine kinase n=1 Tax=Marivirga aurantiaca TaxID=2802615 RepID=A0A934WX54_9BACT|nr:ATP-binding protein [Marivirga aurantiaca]MBK6264557.1 PAS domain-containing sensor histidine kinase [Marivirga aurantiaca]
MKKSHSIAWFRNPNLELKRIFDASSVPLCIYSSGSEKITARNRAYRWNKNLLSKSKNVEKELLKILKDFKRIHFDLNLIHLEEDFYLVECHNYFNTIRKGMSSQSIQKLEEEKFHSEVMARELGKKLARSIVQFQNIAEIAPIGILFTDYNLKIRWFNRKAEQLFGTKSILQNSLTDLISVKMNADFHEKLMKMISSNKNVKLKFSIINLKNGSKHYINSNAFESTNKETGEISYVFILEDITESFHFSDEINKRNFELTHTNHQLDKFLYSVSHNIRGPVASLEGLLNVIEISDVLTVNKLKHHLRLNLRLLNSFVNDLANVSTNIHKHTQFEKVNLQEILEEQILFVENIYGDIAHKTINIDHGRELITDTERFEMVLKNLLKNSFQYRDKRKEKFELQISASYLDGFHLIEILDNGIGISDQVKPQVFDMFYRGTELSTGNGMGLYSAREILKKMGGTINIESQDSQWTKVKIYLPIKV